MLSLLVGSAAFAQTLTVSGVVTDASTGEPVPFAAIQIAGTQTGGATDVDGNYSITVSSSGTLIFSSVGYKNVEIPVDGQSRHDVQLHPDSETLAETIVVAFGTSTKEAFTGSAAVVKSSDISKVQTSDVTRSLEGLVAGVQMTTSSGSLGSSPSIIIRGISSINADSTPLYVVDGIPYGGDMNNINPADIESMTVLKDAASNALYGARGANGVIMITTKKGKSGQATVNVDAKWGVNTKALQFYDYITDPGQYYEMHYRTLYDYYRLSADGNYTNNAAHVAAASALVLSSNQGGLGYNIYNIPEGQYLVGSNGRLNPNATLGRRMAYNGQEYYLTADNWMDAVYQTGFRQEYNVSVSGSSDRASVHASFGYLNNKGIVYGNDMYRFTGRLKAEYQAKEWLRIGANIGYTNFNWNNSNGDEGSAGSTGNIFGFAATMAPIYPVYIRDGQGNILIDSHGITVYDFGNGMNAGLTRPNNPNANALSLARLDISNSEGNAVTTQAFAEVRFLKDFKFTFNAGFNLDETRSTDMSNMYYGQFASNGGSISKGHSRYFALNLQEYLDYNKTIAQVHHIGAMIGHENYNTTSSSLSASKTKMFSLDNLELNGAVVDAQSAASSRGRYNTEGYFTRVQYDYDNKIFVSASYRLDASSRFAVDYRWANFWSAGVGWLINREPWFKAQWVDMLKIKASIGSQGNDNIGNYLYTDTYGISNNEGELAISFAGKGNPQITWETNTNINAGVDFELLGGRIRGGIEYFYRLTSDMLFWFTVPRSLGYSGYYDNIGDMRNSGVEFNISATAVNRRNFRWDINFNATHYTNKILMLPEENKTLNIDGHGGFASGNKYIGEGLPLNTFYIRKYAGIDHEDGQSQWWQDIKDADGTLIRRVKTKDYSAATQYLCEDTTPKLYGGFGTSIEAGGFDFAVQFTYSLGGKTYDSGYAALMSSPSTSVGSNFHKDALNAWTPENPGSDIPRIVYQDQYTSSESDRFLVPASYLNIQNAQLGYTLPKKWTDAIRLSRVRVYLMCDNIWYWSYRQGLDPRFSFSGSTNYAYNSPIRTFSGGINITF